jgi:ribosomal protein S18 acetylase RimI-like enzyme
MNIRYAKFGDAELLARIGGETFWDTYHTESILKQTHIKAHIEKTFNSKVLKVELEQEKIIYLIAENESEEIGYVRLLTESTRAEVSGEKPLEISRIYLRKKFWGQKLGTELLERCFAEAGEQRCDVIWLSVWKYNERAISFYKKHGLKKVGEHFFYLAGSPEIDFIMEKILG